MAISESTKINYAVLLLIFFIIIFAIYPNPLLANAARALR